MDGKTEKVVFLPQPIEAEAKSILSNNNLEVVVAPEATPEKVIPLLENAWAIVLRTGIEITRDLLDHAPHLKTISRTGGGVDNVDLEAATERNIIVTSSLGVNTDSVMEHCLALILALQKQLLLMDQEVREGNFSIRYQNIPRDLHGKTLGVVGFGRIGSKLAQACHQIFGMKILACDMYLTPQVKEKFSSWVNFLNIDQLFSRSDVVSLHVPLSKQTRGIVNRDLFGLMKSDAIIINTSRGEIVREKDLIDALQKERIAGAGLDVFESEPLPAHSPLLTCKNVILTPHSAALTKECVVRMATSAAERVVHLLNGIVPDNVANPAVLEHGQWEHLKQKKIN